MHGHARIRPIPALHTRRLIPGRPAPNTLRRNEGRRRAAGRIWARRMRELSWTMYASCAPLPAKAGEWCSCFDDRVAHALASDKRGGLWAHAGVAVVASCAHRQICCLRPARLGCGRRSRPAGRYPLRCCRTRSPRGSAVVRACGGSGCRRRPASPSGRPAQPLRP